MIVYSRLSKWATSRRGEWAATDLTLLLPFSESPAFVNPSNQKFLQLFAALSLLESNAQRNYLQPLGWQFWNGRNLLCCFFEKSIWGTCIVWFRVAVSYDSNHWYDWFNQCRSVRSSPSGLQRQHFPYYAQSRKHGNTETWWQKDILTHAPTKPLFSQKTIWILYPRPAMVATQLFNL